jgi:cytochrome c biogenesis protein CcmG, thiol:disulfide interchange protein DsbE
MRVVGCMRWLPGSCRKSARSYSVLCLLLTAACDHANYPASAAHPLLGQPLPPIRHRTTLDGQPLDTDRLAGRPIVVKFFADYCEPCKATLVAAQHIHTTHPNAVFVGVDEDESADVAAAVASHFGLTFPVILDPSNVLSGRFRVRSIPMTFVADTGGTIRWVGGEGQTEDELRAAVEAAR